MLTFHGLTSLKASYFPAEVLMRRAYSQAIDDSVLKTLRYLGGGGGVGGGITKDTLY